MELNAEILAAHRFNREYAAIYVALNKRLSEIKQSAEPLRSKVSAFQYALLDAFKGIARAKLEMRIETSLVIDVFGDDWLRHSIYCEIYSHRLDEFIERCGFIGTKLPKDYLEKLWLEAKNFTRQAYWDVEEDLRSKVAVALPVSENLHSVDNSTSLRVKKNEPQRIINSLANNRLNKDEEINMRAENRAAVIEPILQKKKWKRGRLATEAGVGKNSVYEYLNGKRARISPENRNALAETLGILPERLPD